MPRLLGHQILWVPDLKAGVIWLGDDRICLIREGLDAASIDAALDEAWNEWWDQARDDVIDRLTAACLSMPQPAHPHAQPDAS